MHIGQRPMLYRWTMPPTQVQHQRAGSGSRRCADPEMLRPHYSTDPDHISANWGRLELGAQSGHKSPPACSVMLLMHDVFLSRLYLFD